MERQFALENSLGLLPNIIERLRGTPIRLRHICNSLSAQDLEFKYNDKWSIKEHIGHLNDLESLHEGRIEDFLNRKEILRAADMTNAATYKANHNSQDVEHLLKIFETARHTFIEHLLRLDDATQKFSSLHPRLKQMMRPVDMAFFTAEHDDQHFAIIRETLNKLDKKDA